MAEHLSDEEQLESFKRWWKENGIFTIVAVVLVAGGYFGWEFWKDYRQERAETASVLYQKMMVAADVEPGDKLSVSQEASVTEFAGNLRDEYANTQYARYGALLLAKVAVDKNDLNAAAEQLQWVADGADEGLELIATLRLARVEAARGNLDLAISMLNIEAKTLASAYAEARGDLYLLKGDKSAAYESYQQALQQVAAADNRTRSLLELKLNQVASIMEPAEEEQDDSEEDA